MTRPRPILALVVGAFVVMLLASQSGAQDPTWQTQSDEARKKITDAITKEFAAAAERVTKAVRDSAAKVQGGTQPAPATKKPWLGLSALAAPADFLAQRNREYGLLVERVVKDGPASKAGILAGDLLTAANGKPLKSRDDLRELLSSLKPGDVVEFDITRTTGWGKIKVTLGEAPTVEEPAVGQPADADGWIGIQVATHDAGLIVMGVVEDSPADKAGVKVSDVIVAIDGHPVRTPADLRRAFVAKKIGDTLTLQIRQGQNQPPSDVKVEIQKRPKFEYDPRPQQNPAMQLPEFPGRPDPAVMRRINDWNNQGCNLLRQHKYQEAIPYFEKMLETVPNEFTALYNLACAYSLLGNKEKAVEYLERSFLAGFTNWAHVEQDSDLDNIRDHPKYVELMKSRDHFERVRANKKLDQIRDLLTKYKIDVSTYLFEIDEKNKFIFATNRSKDVLKQLTHDLVTYAEAQWKHLFIRKQNTYIAIVVTNEDDFRKMVPNRMIGGFYNPTEEALIAPALDHTLTHEFTHALHFADVMQINQMHSIWYLEGLATCFENSALKPVKGADGIEELVPTPMPNERLPQIQEAVQNGTTIPLATMMRMTQGQFMQQAALMYAQSRYFVVYLWTLGKLKEFHKEYCDTWQRDPSGITAVEKVLGKSLAEIESEFKAWVKALPPFVGHTGRGGAYLGVDLEDVTDGLKVTATVPDSPAAKGGLKAGDVIVTMDGKRIISRHTLLEFLSNRKAGDKIVVIVMREGQSTELTIELGARQ